MKKRGIALLLGISLALGATGCGKEVPGAIKPGYNADVTAAEPKVLRAGINQFAYEMYDRLPEDENIFFSPYSLCTALSLLDVGAGSETKEELENMLGITDLDAWNVAMKEYLAREWTDDTYVLTANSVWMQKDFEWSDNVETAFLQPADYYYNSELFEVDFKGKPDAAIKKMNAWADKNTKGMIPKIINKLPSDTVLSLMNAVYFEGKWETPFYVNDTHERTFHGTAGDSIVEMMCRNNQSYRYIEQNGIKGIALPYKDSSIAMKVFIPASNEEETDIGTIFAAMTPEEREALLDSLDAAKKEEIANLVLPKFTDEHSIDGLTELLQDMGMESAFQENANFDSISEDIYVSLVLHKAKIEVDEQGTKAAAVTVIAMQNCEAVMEKKVVNFIADRPFYYVLQDTETGVILFMGRVNNLE